MLSGGQVVRSSPPPTADSPPPTADDMERGGGPVDIPQLEPDDLTGSEAIGAHHQQERMVAQPTARGCVDRPQQALHVLP